MTTYRILKQKPSKTCSEILALVELDEDDLIVIEKRIPEVIFSEVSYYRSD